MASFAMHYAIAKEYCKKNENVNFASFARGSIQLDLAQDKSKAHYTTPPKTQEIAEIARNKVDLVTCVNNTTLDSDFALGEFLHLLTDYLFFQKLPKAFNNVGITDTEQARKVLINDYIATNAFLAERYMFNLMELPENGRAVSHEKPVLMNTDEIVSFIDDCASLNLREVYENIKNNKFWQAILP